MYAGTIVPCDGSVNPEAAYYQMDMPPPPPPCYTIATGLPTYDEALHHHQHQFAFGMKFIYPTLAAVHHQAANLISSWEKYDMPRSKVNNAASPAKAQKGSPSKSLKCKSAQNSTNSSASTGATTASSLLLPPSYDAAATMALLAPEDMQTNDSVSIDMNHHCEESEKNSSDLTDIITV